MVDSSPSSRSFTRDLVPFFLVVLAAYLLYLLTLQPIMGWGTGARVAHHSLDLSLPDSGDAHAVRILFGFLFDRLMNALGTGADAWVQNLLSAIIGAFSLGLIYVIGRERGASRFASALTAITLGMSHLFWHVSVISGPYTVQVLLLLGVLYSVLRWRNDGTPMSWFLTTWFLVGVGSAETVYILFMVPALVFFFVTEPRETSLRSGVLGGGMFLAGGVLGVGLPILVAAAAGGTPTMDLLGLLAPFRRPVFSSVWSVSTFTTDLLRYAGALTYQFPLFGLLIGGAGIWLDLWGDRSFLGLVMIPFLGVVFFSSPVRSPESFHQMILSFVLFTVWIGRGMDGLVTYIDRHRGRIETDPGSMKFALVSIFVCAPFLLYFSVPETEDGDVFSEIHPDRELGYRNERAYFLKPWKLNDRSSEALWNDLRDLPRGSILIADPEVAGALLYYRTARMKGAGKPPFAVHHPGEPSYRRHPVKTVRTLMGSLPKAKDGKQTKRDPGVFLVGSHPLYQRERLEKAFHFIRRRGGRTRATGGRRGGRGPGLATVDHTGFLRLIPRKNSD